MKKSDAAQRTVLGREEALLLLSFGSCSWLFQKNKEDELIMVLAWLALAEGIFSQAGTDSMLFLSKAVETTVYVLHFRNTAVKQCM